MGLRWSPANVSKKSLVILAAISLLAYFLVEKTKVVRKEAFFDEKSNANSIRYDDTLETH